MTEPHTDPHTTTERARREAEPDMSPRSQRQQNQDDAGSLPSTHDPAAVAALLRSAARVCREAGVDPFAPEPHTDAHTTYLADRTREEARLEREAQAYWQRAGGTVYFIRSDDGPVKIGYTAGDPETRRKTLQVGNPAELFVDAVMPGDVGTERRLHERFAAGRRVGEWFDPATPGLAELVRDVRHMEGFPGDLKSEQAKAVLAFVNEERGTHA